MKKKKIQKKGTKGLAQQQSSQSSGSQKVAASRTAGTGKGKEYVTAPELRSLHPTSPCPILGNGVQVDHLLCSPNTLSELAWGTG